MTAVTLAPDRVDLSAAFADVNRRYFMGKLPLIVVIFADLPGMWGRYDPTPNERIVISSKLQHKPKAVKLTLIHECLHAYVARFYPIKEQRGGSHHSPAWELEMKRIGWIMGVPQNAWKKHPELFPLWTRDGDT